MSLTLQVFVSSSCHELRDLRAAVRTWLLNLGLVPVLSDEGGFPHIDGMPPYATCLRALEECPLVIGIIDRNYGRAFDDWGPYGKYKGCSPTHAEIRHALDLGKRVLIYVHNDTWAFYEVWRNNPDALRGRLPQGLEEGTLKLFEELKKRSPAPWIEHFGDVSELISSLNKEFVNQLYTQLRDQEKQSADLATYFLDKIADAAPEVREKITSGLNPDLVADRDGLQRKLAEIEARLTETQGTTQERISALQLEKDEVQAKVESVSKQLQHTSLMLAQAAMRDLPWLDFIRRTMMPKQPGRVPFHHSAEVALRGYKPTGGQLTPMLREITWAKLPEHEHGLHRGYKAGLIFRGSNFVPGITFTRRRRGETGPPVGNSDYFWHLPNVYFGDYLEVSTGDNEPESFVSWRDFEFQVKNPEGQKSDWILCSYPFDDEALHKVRTDALENGKVLLSAGKAAEAVEPLRKGMVFSDRMLGGQHPETIEAKATWERALDEAALSKLRFRVGDRLSVHSGPHAGNTGIVERLLLRHLHAYVMKSPAGELFQASDQQVERETVVVTSEAE
jgi:hypothetical protein